jgi:hypothetical protein
LIKWQHFVCLPMIVILPVSLTAQETAAAMLRSNGVGVLVNRNPAPASAALFSNDLVETQKAGVARIEASGSTADVSPETMVQFEGNELVLDHGSLSVNTSRGLRVRVGCVTITPVHDAEWTHYDVVDRDGKVTVSSLKSDTYIDAKSRNFQQAKEKEHSNRVIVREGEQKSREEKCGAGYVKGAGELPGIGAVLNSPWAVGLGAAGVVTIMCYALCQTSDPMSPTRP